MRQEMMGFGMAVASAGPYANNLHLDPGARFTKYLTIYRKIIVSLSYKVDLR